jgi:hypothetical protein
MKVGFWDDLNAQRQTMNDIDDYLRPTPREKGSGAHNRGNGWSHQRLNGTRPAQDESLAMQLQTISFGSEQILYTIVERPQRRTLGIEVHPNGSVIVLRPPHCSDELLRQKLKKRTPWISRQLARVRHNDSIAQVRQYLSGESYRYLGRQYRLKVVRRPNTSRPAVRLTRNELLVLSPSRLLPSQIKRLLETWALERARHNFNSVLDARFEPFQRCGYDRPLIFIRQMKRRLYQAGIQGHLPRPR